MGHQGIECREVGTDGPYVAVCNSWDEANLLRFDPHPQRGSWTQVDTQVTITTVEEEGNVLLDCSVPGSPTTKESYLSLWPMVLLLFWLLGPTC